MYWTEDANARGRGPRAGFADGDGREQARGGAGAIEGDGADENDDCAESEEAGHRAGIGAAVEQDEVLHGDGVADDAADDEQR